jgi:hypothetical protein
MNIDIKYLLSIEADIASARDVLSGIPARFFLFPKKTMHNQNKQKNFNNNLIIKKRLRIVFNKLENLQDVPLAECFMRLAPLVIFLMARVDRIIDNFNDLYLIVGVRNPICPGKMAELIILRTRFEQCRCYLTKLLTAIEALR